MGGRWGWLREELVCVTMVQMQGEYDCNSLCKILKELIQTFFKSLSRF